MTIKIENVKTVADTLENANDIGTPIPHPTNTANGTINMAI